MNRQKITVLAVVALLALVGSFYGGMTYARGKKVMFGSGDFRNMTPEQRQQFGQRAGMARNGGMNGGFIMGEILNKDDSSITVKLPDGGSKIIFYSGTTNIAKSAAGSASDLAPGMQVTANGSPNSDGSLTAQSIQIRPDVPQQQKLQ
jgi:hypothetical protein